MTEEKPLSEKSEAPEESNATDGITAALSALTNAAAPVRDEKAPAETPTPEDATVAFTASPSAAATVSADAPPPPPAPESVQEYPAPTGTPVAVNAAPTVAPVAPAPATKRKKWPWILAICIIAGAVMLGGMVACASSLMNAAFHAVQHNERHYDYDDLFNPDEQDGFWNYYYGGMDVTFDNLLDIFNVNEGDTSHEGAYGRGGYRVGGTDGIAPGLYYLGGTEQGVSNFYIFESDADPDEPRYEAQTMVEYFGNYYAELEDGDAIIFVPFDKSSVMHLADAPMDVVPPYQSGCYRVGIDIPAGTYTITCDADVARETDSEAGAYVMKDLDFGDDSITESVYVIKGGRQTITVEAGEYLELFATIATPATASTKIPLQHAESEFSYAA